ncbi:MAG: glycoside hydrolase family 31 protein [Cytophagales bacterium]|nr:glycoside hydrolase family 31 protein [Cytophagales bacterium]
MFRAFHLRCILIFLLGFACSWQVLAQDRTYVSHNFDGKKLEISTSDGKVVLEPFSTKSVEVTFEPSGTFQKDSSLAVVYTPSPELAVSFKETKRALDLETEGVRVHVNLKPFNVSYYYRDSQLVQEEKGYQADSIYRGFAFAISGDEVIYGAGERSTPLNRRGHYFELYNKAHYAYGEGSSLMNYGLPLVFSSKKYALLFDNGGKGYIDIDNKRPNVIEFGSVGKRMAYYLIAGDNYADLMGEYTRMTGRQPLPPRWALGNIQSRMGYRSQQEVLDIANKMVDKGFPLDALVIDLFWFGPDVQGHMGQLDWDYGAFPQPKKMIDSLKSMGIKTVLITEPFVITNTKNYSDGDEKRVFALDTLGETGTYDFYFGNTALIDIFKPSAGEWFWKKYDKQNKIGVAGWWGDLGEPEVHPEWIRHVNGTADEVHNIFAHYWEKMVYEKHARDYPNRRLFHINRSGFAGSQRYSIFPWSGDVGRNWSGLRAQMPIMLTMSMSGLGYHSSDLGGFASQGEPDNELYTRWLQMGAFNPVFRPHGDSQNDIKAEPVFFTEQTQAIVRDFIKLRYRLMPYIYSTAWQNTQKGMPLVRPTFFEEDTRQTREITDQYLFGEAFLVAPVMEPGLKKREVYLPNSADWFDFWTGKRYDGGQTVTAELNLETIPVFVKAGSFLPMVPDYNNMEEYSSAKLAVHYFPGSSASRFAMYEDDGVTKDANLKGEFELIEFSGKQDADGLKLSMEGNKGTYAGKPEEREIAFVVHAQEQAPKKVWLNGKKIKLAKTEDALKTLSKGAYWNAETHELKVKFSWDNAQNVNIRIK